MKIRGDLPPVPPKVFVHGCGREYLLGELNGLKNCSRCGDGIAKPVPPLPMSNEVPHTSEDKPVKRQSSNIFKRFFGASDHYTSVDSKKE
jgi:hypothetical protein